MAQAVSLTGQDAFTLNNRIFSDLADGDAITLTYPNKVSNVKTGKDGNALFGFNATGKQAMIVIRLVRGSNDDKFMNNLLSQQMNSFASFVLMTGTMVKKSGDGLGNIGNDTYAYSGAVFDEQVGAKTNVEGDTEQSVSIYHIHCANCVRVIS